MHRTPQSPCKGRGSLADQGKRRGPEVAVLYQLYLGDKAQLCQAELRGIPHGMRACIVEVQRLYIRGLHLEREEGKGTRGEWSLGGPGV